MGYVTMFDGRNPCGLPEEFPHYKTMWDNKSFRIVFIILSIIGMTAIWYLTP